VNPGGGHPYAVNPAIATDQDLSCFLKLVHVRALSISEQLEYLQYKSGVAMAER